MVAPAPAGGLLVTDHHDDEPMPIPSTWRQPVNSDDERWYRQQLGAAALGLVAGLIVVVPSVLWLSGWFGGPQARSAARPAAADQGAAIKMADVKVKVVPLEKTENASQYVTAAVDPRPAAVEAPPPVMEKAPVTLPAPTPIAAPSPKPVEPQRPRVEEVLAQARRHIERGDINSARELLLAGQSAAPGPIAFTLAETYDPNMLAAWNTRGVISDVHKARSLYLKALELGDGRARKRLDELR